MTVLPLAFETRPAPVRPPVDPVAPLIVTFGIVSTVKNPRVLIEAFALVAAERPRARLVFAGEGSEDEIGRWRALTVQLSVADRVAFEGHASPERWDELLITADLAVQLRLVSNGEASAAVTECLAAGLPTVVTDLGWCAELPDAAVVKVPVELTARALASAMAAALDDERQRATQCEVARAHAEVNSFAAVAELYLELLC